MLAKLTAVLIAYGPAGILVLAFIDSAGIPVASGMDALAILVAAKAPSRALFAASMGVLGSLIGNLVLFLGARAGARRFVKVAPLPGDKQRFREWFERYGLLTIFIPAMLPIPLPLKVFVISAAVVGTPLRTFVFVIVLGRSIRSGAETGRGIGAVSAGAHLAFGWRRGGAVRRAVCATDADRAQAKAGGSAIIGPMIDQPFFQLTLPLMVTIVIAAFTAAWSSNKRIDEISHRLDDTNRRLDDVDRRFGDVDRRFDEVLRVLMSIDHRLTVLEERSSLVRG